MNPSRLVAKVIDELEWDPGVEEDSIEVAIVDGVVVLTGDAPSYMQKLNATKAAKRVGAVGAVRNELEIDLPDRVHPSDEELAKHIANRFEWYSDLSTDKVKVVVENGHVILTGEVQWHFQREEIEDFVGRITGVCGIENALTLTRKAEAGNIEERIKQAFKRNAISDAGQIGIEAKDGKVTLTGIVHAPYERALARRAAWSAAGVHCVVDELHSLNDETAYKTSHRRE